MERNVFLARQPILDRSRRVIGYELLFRSSAEAVATEPLSEGASARVLTDAVMAFGIDNLTQGKPAFINAPRSLLLDGLTGLEAILPPSQVVFELLEDIEADDDVLAACGELRRAGYTLALDDFVLTERNAALVPLAGYVKIDLLSTPDPAEVQRQIALLCRGAGPALLAEKVETLEQFEMAFGRGFSYFQGYFFGRPATHRARSLPGHRLGHLQLLRALQDPALDVLKLERLIEHDASLCYRILRTVNSAAFGQAHRVTSIRQAVVLMGVGVVRRWVSLWVLGGLNEEAHPELLVMSAIRARCCELLADQLRGSEAVPEGFLLGMCSLLDAILDQPMQSVIDQLPLSRPMQAALLGEDNSGRRLLECAIAQERGDWDGSRRLAIQVGLPPQILAAAHQAAMQWSTDFLQAA